MPQINATESSERSKPAENRGEIKAQNSTKAFPPQSFNYSLPFMTPVSVIMGGLSVDPISQVPPDHSKVSYVNCKNKEK